MRSMRRPLAVDGLIVAVAAAAMIELWLSRRDDASVATTLLALGATATLLAHRGSPAVAVLAAAGAQAALLEQMPRPMISMAVALALAAALAGAASTARTRRAWAVGFVGLAGVVAVSADYALRFRPDRDAVAFAVVAAAAAVCWAGSFLLVRLTEHADTSGATGAALSRQGTGPDAESDRRMAVARDVADAVSSELSALLVETVAAQQALVRDAHPEDSLLRMRAAEEHAYQASNDLRRLLAATGLAATVSTPGDTAETATDDSAEASDRSVAGSLAERPS